MKKRSATQRPANNLSSVRAPSIESTIWGRGVAVRARAKTNTSLPPAPRQVSDFKDLVWPR